MKTKKQELEILDKVIAELGRDSYLGPYFADIRHDIERNITSDLEAGSCLPMPSEMIKDAQEKIAILERNRLEIANKQINERFTRISENIVAFVKDQLSF